MTVSMSTETQNNKGPLNLRSFVRKQPFAFFILTAFIAIFLFIAFFYFINILHWSRGPDFGWTVAFQEDQIVLFEVSGKAEEAGLRVGDRFVSVNHRTVGSYFLLQKDLNRKAGEENVYEVERNGSIYTFTVRNEALGFGYAFLKFGFTWLLGIIFLTMGASVFFMKPDSRPSWAFLIMMFSTGLYITFTYISRLSPEWLNSVLIFSAAFLPASILHLAQTFPEERGWTKKHLFSLWVPYSLSFLLFVGMKLSAPIYTDVPVPFKVITSLYLVASIVFFLGSILYTFLKSSGLSRVRAEIVLVGVLLAIGVPVANLITVLFLGRILLPHPVFNLPFYLIFPLSIGYSIVRHNLFDADVYIKRAVGYIIMTVLVGIAFFSMQVTIRSAVIQPVFGEYSENIYPALFAILVVFFFNPVNRRVQGTVEKLFFRKKFDYKQTITKVSDALTSMLDINEVIRKIINTVRKEMFIDKAGVILFDPLKAECQSLFIGDDSEAIKQNGEECVKYDDPLIKLLSKDKQLITVYDLAENPYYSDVKDSCEERFSRMGVSMVLPLIYQGNVKGALALGYKKSGHFYTREDIDLLNTLANSGAVAIENAKLVDQIKKEEIIRTNLSRYLSPQVVEDIIHKDVEINLGGDRKTVTTLFMDLIGFTSLSEKLQPEEVVSILNEYFTEMSKGIFKWQGTLDKFAGDQIMAFWGAPFPQPNHAELAVQCALEVSKTLDELQEKWAKEGKPVLNCGIGINTGEVLVGNIGVEGMKMDYTVIGDAVNLASRVEKMTRNYDTRILITEFTVNHIRNAVESGKFGHIDLVNLSEVKIKGKKEKVRIYKLETAEAS